MRLEAEKIGVRLGSREILHDIDFALANHKFIGVIGPNGSGKSTLLRTFYQALHPWRGRLTIDGRPAKELKPRETARLFSVLPQQYGAEIDLTTEETMLMGRYPYKKMFEGFTKEELEKVKEVLAALGLEHLSGRRLSAVSGGERQMILLARSIMQDTPCLLLDEPTNHLDIRHQALVLDALAALGKQVAAVFHDLNLAAKYCDYLYFMKDGSIVRKGTPKDVLTAENIELIYGLKALIMENPVTGRPVIIL
ncbi:MAG: ABC transporter ATP-binding protein [Deltaproteobacteria bacterium]|jgi:iron complex transport system ATP-binding protein|nr:ABC transporter ATP-binding protein [Deltaproteobacteria bacterium]